MDLINGRDLFALAGLGMLTAGIWLLAGLPWALVVAGGLLLAVALLATISANRQA